MKKDTKKKPFDCSHCGAGVSKPYFYQGGVYGWTCIKFVNPKAKRYKGEIKTSGFEVKWVKFDNEFDKNGRAAVLIDNRIEIAHAIKASDNAFNVYGYDAANDLHYATVYIADQQ